jgi:hypothetical protein
MGSRLIQVLRWAPWSLLIRRTRKDDDLLGGGRSSFLYGILPHHYTIPVNGQCAIRMYLAMPTSYLHHPGSPALPPTEWEANSVPQVSGVPCRGWKGSGRDG